mmetsp:Transcript_35341/g.101623  ORF Transcript_35341/g.101623 Transcript_35341/m.101623 type:complete len:326 (+) Transcript_35341:173-1150(+)
MCTSIHSSAHVSVSHVPPVAPCGTCASSSMRAFLILSRPSSSMASTQVQPPPSPTHTNASNAGISTRSTFEADPLWCSPDGCWSVVSSVTVTSAVRTPNFSSPFSSFVTSTLPNSNGIAAMPSPFAPCCCCCCCGGGRASLLRTKRSCCVWDISPCTWQAARPASVSMGMGAKSAAKVVVSMAGRNGSAGGASGIRSGSPGERKADIPVVFEEPLSLWLAITYGALAMLSTCDASFVVTRKSKTRRASRTCICRPPSMSSYGASHAGTRRPADPPPPPPPAPCAVVGGVLRCVGVLMGSTHTSRFLGSPAHLGISSVAGPSRKDE